MNTFRQRNFEDELGEELKDFKIAKKSNARKVIVRGENPLADLGTPINKNFKNSDLLYSDDEM